MDVAALVDELRSLGKGPAMLRLDLKARLGPQTRAAFDIEESDSPAQIRQKVSRRVAELVPDEPDTYLRTTLLGALALLPGADHRLLTAREEWLANRLGWDSRTVRRRVREAYLRLAEALAEGPSPRSRAAEDGFVVRRFVATMRLDTPRPQLHERRMIRVTAAKLGHVLVRLTVPRAPGAAVSEVEVRADQGGRIVDTKRESAEHFVFTVEPPRLLGAGEEHEFGLTYTIPAGQPMRQHYVFQPLTPCEWFELTVHFDQTQPPASIWLLDGVAPRVLDADTPAAPRLTADRRAVVRRHFTDLRQGLAYGVRWA